MTTELLLYTQIGALVGFVGIVFVLYRLLIKQKDATIESLKERIGYQEAKAKTDSPDVLIEGLSKRIKILSEELERLSGEQAPDSEKIKHKEHELEETKDAYERLQQFALHATGMSVSYFCPRCEEPTLQSIDCRINFFPKATELFQVAYSCGYVTLNKTIQSECKSAR